MQTEGLTRLPGLDLITKLSSGGMGDVLLARRVGVNGFEKLLAVKTIRGPLVQRAEVRAMFLDEARLVARLEHPTIVQAYDFGQSDDVLYLAMEYVWGIGVHHLLASRHTPIPPLVAARVASEAARGLHMAHELKDADGRSLDVVHRDVSPGNLILSFDGHVKILDFGIAWMRERESPETAVGNCKGKLTYMSPEQMRGESVDRRADVYSLSVVLYEMLTGRKLFDRTNPTAVLAQKEKHGMPPPSRCLQEGLPDGLDALVLNGLEPRREDRPQAAHDFAQRLDQIIASNTSDRSVFPRLVDFVDRSLAEERDNHRRWLMGVLAGPPLARALEPPIRTVRSVRSDSLSADEDKTVLLSKDAIERVRLGESAHSGRIFLCALLVLIALACASVIGARACRPPSDRQAQAGGGKSGGTGSACPKVAFTAKYRIERTPQLRATTTPASTNPRQGMDICCTRTIRPTIPTAKIQDTMTRLRVA